MADIRKDPSLLQLHDLIKTEELLNRFLREHRLLAAPQALGYTRGRDPKPFIGYCSRLPFNPNKPACTGVITEILKNGLPLYRCTVCKNEKSAHHGPSAYDPTVLHNGMTFFNNVDILQRPNRKLSPRNVLFMTFCLAYEIPPSKLSIFTGSKLSDATTTSWSLYLRKLAIKELSTYPKMGGVNDIIEVDETYLKGKRKSNRGRLLTGNLGAIRGNRRNNYMARSAGPWIFGMVCRRTKEVRMVYVPDRSAATLIPIIKRHVAPGSTIMSDEWRAYNTLSSHEFHHLKVNHSQNFIDPITGASTQLIERQWRKIKLPLLKQGPGVALTTIRSHLANFWWLSINGRHVCKDPFLCYIDLIAKYATL